MSKFWAEVPLGSYQTVNKLPEGYSGEYRIRIVSNMKYEPMKALNVLLSAWVAGMVKIDYVTVFKLFEESEWLLSKDPVRAEPKNMGYLTYIISQYGIENLRTNPQWFRKILIARSKISPCLYSPRSLNGEALKRYQSIKFRVEIIPGLEKTSFPEVAYIGVGYRDKGYCRKKELDGRQSWQEICNANVEFPQHYQQDPRDRTLALITDQNWSEIVRRQRKRSRKMRKQEFSLLY